ncbi:PEP-CTERM sorting domain-containing protein [Crocosphaera watsonii]|uniref:PEP-CTERM sorting domain-containing protein n=1 Tax=Crocosphaera watsonii TaxID=263511 RepID=UPI0030D9B5B4
MKCIKKINILHLSILELINFCKENYILDVFVYLNGTQLYADFLSGTFDSGSFNTDLSLEEGDILDFVLGSPNIHNDDTTGLDLSITTTLSVPEPSTMIGLGVLATFALGKGVKRKLNQAKKK